MADQQTTDTAGLTVLGKTVVALVVIGLIAGGAWMLRAQLFPTESGSIVHAGTGEAQKAAGGNPAEGAAESAAPNAEAKDAAGITTTKEYKYVPAEKLPPVKGVSSYRYDDKTVVFPINMWIGWLPIV